MNNPNLALAPPVVEQRSTEAQDKFFANMAREFVKMLAVGSVLATVCGIIARVVINLS